jgi:hypothetical protein
MNIQVSPLLWLHLEIFIWCPNHSVCFAIGREDRYIAYAIRDKGFNVVHLFTMMSTNNSGETFSAKWAWTWRAR